MFDDDYRRQVLEPARAAGDQPPEDLRARYALTEPLIPAQVTAQVKQVRQCWRRARGQLKYRKLVDRLEAEHRELAPAFAAAERGDLGPLVARLRGGEERTARRRAEVRARLLDAAGAVRMVTPGDIAGIARSGGVGADELAWLARAEGVDVREPDPLPASPPYAGYARAREALDVLGQRQLADFLLGGPVPGPFRVLDGAGPDPRVVSRVAAEWARRSRDTSSSNAETVLIAVKSVDDLSALVLYDIVDRLRERHRQRASEQALLHHAVQDLGLEVGDARRLVFAVRLEDGPGGGPAGRLRELLDAGQVHAAAELSHALPQEGDTAVLGLEAAKRVETATGLRDRALAEPDPDAAWLLLTDALHLVPDLPGAEDLRRRLPPRPVFDVRAEPTAAGVLVTWQAAPSAGAPPEFRVLRRSSSAPGPADTPLATVDGMAFRDEAPPINERLHYAVVAVRGEAAAVPALAEPVVVRPEPEGLELAAGDAAVTGRWALPPQAAGAVVVRSFAGRSVTVEADRLGFTDRDVQNDTAYQYRVSAVYLDEDGSEQVTRGIIASVTPSAPPSPVEEIRLVPDTLDATRLLIAFTPPTRGTPEVVLLPGPPPWPYGTIVSVGEARDAGRPLPATPTAEGLAVRTRGGGVLLVITVSGRFAAIGPHHRHVSLPAPTGLTAELRGGHLHIGFDWPPDVPEAQLTLSTSGGRDEVRRITRAAYEAQGVRIPVGDGFAGAEIAVAACAGTMVGPSASVLVEGRRVVGYDVERSGPRWRRSLAVRLRVESDRPVRIGELRLVVRQGKVMPNRASDGETLQQWRDLEVDGELTLTVPEPSVRQPYWLRCFTTDERLELADPPIRRLQVS